MDKTLIAVVGPTAIGKTSWAIRLAKHYNTEIVSADSRQFYKEMKIGTAVPSNFELAEVPHHFIQHRSIAEPWSVGDYERAAIGLLKKLFKKKNVVVAVGGSGLYLQALARGLDEFPDVDRSIRENLINKFEEMGLPYLQNQLKEADPDYYELVDLDNPRRLIRALEVFLASGKPYSSYLAKPKANRSFNTIYLGLSAERPVVYQRIEQRVDLMMEAGLLIEAEDLIGYRNLTALQTVGYQELFKYFDGQWDLETAVKEIKKNTRRFAKRQLTWLRKNKSIIWVNHKEPLMAAVNKIEVLIKEAENE